MQFIELGEALVLRGIELQDQFRIQLTQRLHLFKFGYIQALEGLDKILPLLVHLLVLLHDLVESRVQSLKGVFILKRCECLYDLIKVHVEKFHFWL